jgi:polyisoprenoid-binding protein YceI
MNKLIAALLAVAPVLATAAPGAWKIDPSHSTVGFSVRHLVISNVRGEFSKYDAKVQLDDADPSRSSVEATIDAASIDTRSADRDGHLRSPDFFDVAKYPTITFRSTKVAMAGPDRLRVTGDLTLHGVTRPVTLEVTTSQEVKGLYGETRRGYTATAQLDRRDFGLVWNKMIEAGPAIGDVVTLTLDLSSVKEPPAPATAAK